MVLPDPLHTKWMGRIKQQQQPKKKQKKKNIDPHCIGAKAMYIISYPVCNIGFGGLQWYIDSPGLLLMATFVKKEIIIWTISYFPTY